MSTTMDALIRAIDSLEEPAAAAEVPQGATRATPVAPTKPLESRGRCHRGHRGHTKLADHGRTHDSDSSITEEPERQEEAAAQKIHLSGVAPVAPVAPTIDSKGKNRGHRLNPCGPLWPLSGIPRGSAVGGVPGEWSKGVARLVKVARPRDYPAAAWQEFITDAVYFLERWGEQAARLGWPTWELFGCCRHAPWGRVQGMGLVLLLRGRDLAALTATEAVIRTATGGHQTYRRKPNDPLHSAERCLVWELGDG